ncbi:MAG: glycoside hydrolase family 16 protein [Bacilli bacterium]|jgi:hypothetical protein
MQKQKPWLLLLIMTLVSSCGTSSSGTTLDNSVSDNTESSSILSSEPNVDEYYGTIEDRVLFSNHQGLDFIERFDDGLSDDIWYTLDGAWHTTVVGAPHNGVNKRNIFYTSDGETDYLAIKGRGFYNREDPLIIGKPEGGVIITKNHLTPGRYEILMAALPREGAVTAMWTYCTTTGNEVTSQNEIDIEIGGTTGPSQFESFWATSWTKRETKQTETVDVSDLFFLNDGQIHKYTFDWYTDYQGSGVRRVDWFVDEKYVVSVDGNVVPEYDMPLWIGVWFPPLWPGNPSFEEDYVLIEEISFRAFENSQYHETCRSQPGYTKTLPSESNIQTISYEDIRNLNKLSNADFETLQTAERDNSYFGWKVDNASKGTVSLTADAKTGTNAFMLTAGPETEATYDGQYIKQTISNVFVGYRYQFSIDAKLLDAASSGNIEIYYRDITGRSINRINLPVESQNYTTYEYDIVMPENSYSLEIDITSEKGSVIYDNASLVFLGLAN